LSSVNFCEEIRYFRAIQDRAKDILEEIRGRRDGSRKEKGFIG
jgi:hypothetical protein